MLLIGEYTEFPAWLPADPGSGIALFNSTEGAEPFANTVLSVHNPSFLCADGYGGFYALDEGPQGLLTHFIPDGKSFYFAEQVAFEAQGSCHLCVSPEHMVKLYPTTTFSEACNIGDGYYKDENGQFQWAPADTRTLDALKKYQDLYQEGILDSEFYSYTRYQGAQKFYVQGTSGLTLEDGHAIMITYIRNGLAEQGLDPDKVLHLAQLVGDDGMYHYREDSNYWGQVMFSPTISQEKFERAMDILDYTCTEEGQNFMNMGFEGIDWKLDENGNYVSLLDPSIQGSATSVLGGKYPSKESSFGGLILPDDFSLVSPNYSHEIQDTVRGFYKLREELSDTTTLLPREYEYEFLSSREKSQATMDLGDEYAKLILKDGELEDNWNTWVEEKMAVVQPVLDQLNK